MFLDDIFASQVKARTRAQLDQIAEEVFGVRPQGGNKLLAHDRKILAMLVDAAKEAKDAEEKFLAAIASFMNGGNFPTEPHPQVLWEEKWNRLRDLLDLANLGPFLTPERLLKIGELTGKR